MSMRLVIASLLALAACRDKALDEAHMPPPAATVAAGSDAAVLAKDDPWTAASAAKDPLPHPLFWKIEKDGKTTYLLGTMHLGVDPTTRLPEIVWQKLDEGPAFAMETDLSQMNKLDLVRRDGTTLRQEIGDTYWRKLEEVFGAHEASRMLGYKPLLPETELSRRGLPATPAMDGVLYGRALNKNKRIVFLEPFEAQATVLLKWMNAQALEDMLDDVPGVEQRSKDMLAAYIEGDDAKIVTIADSERALWIAHGHPEKQFDEQMEDLLYTRNASWIPTIEKMHADGGGFIAVGAMHLLGPRSVLELLAKRGYTVTRITP